MKKLMNKKVYHPVYGEIGEIKDILRGNDNKYVVFRERSVENLTEDQDVLRALPVKRFYLHDKTSELRVDFDPHWITEAPRFTSEDLENHDHQVLNLLNNYYKHNDGVPASYVAVRDQK
ncbi:hypothetical protein C900_00066 [Fulvivirga imtechensis AK7]|uniref:Uncharacterized protein n=2 Tax=Fulvivirga TaxID=396811 RepID=L8K359_9BACT|nr:hypothetical protein C900_00066 [Fulvivirga imtechensis AK7]